jgi:hypothetical protein
MRTQHRAGMQDSSGTVHVLPVRAERPAEPGRRLGSQRADRPATGQVLYLPGPRRDDPERWSGPVRRVLGITGGWLQAVPARRQSGQGAHTERPERSLDRVALRTVHAERRDPRIAARSADREGVPAAFRPVRQPGTRKFVLLSQEI